VVFLELAPAFLPVRLAPLTGPPRSPPARILHLHNFFEVSSSRSYIAWTPPPLSIGQRSLGIVGTAFPRLPEAPPFKRKALPRVPITILSTPVIHRGNYTCCQSNNPWFLSLFLLPLPPSLSPRPPLIGEGLLYPLLPSVFFSGYND